MRTFYPNPQDRNYKWNAAAPVSQADCVLAVPGGFLGSDYVHDLSGRGNHGTGNGVQWVWDNQRGWTCDCDATTDYVSTPLGDLSGDNVSIFARIRPVISGGGPTKVHFGWTGPDGLYLCERWNNTSLFWRMYTKFVPDVDQIEYTGLTSGEWISVGLSGTGTQDDVSFYLNGQYYGGSTFWDPPINYNGGTFRLNHNRVNTFGLVCIFETVLSASQHAWLHDPINHLLVPWRRTLWPVSAGGGTEETATPSAVSVSVTIPSVSTAIEVESSTAPGPVSVSATVPSASTSVEAEYSTSPSPVVASATVPSVTTAAEAEYSSSPSPVSVSATVPSASTSVEAEYSTSPSPVAVSATVPAVGTATQAEYSTSPSPVSVTVTIPSVTTATSGEYTATPSPVVSSVTVPSVTTSIETEATTAPSPVEVSITVPAVSATSGTVGTATPSPVLVGVTIPAVTVATEAEQSTSPSPLSVTATVPAVTTDVQAEYSTAPSPVAVSATVPAATPAVEAEYSTAPVPVSVSVTLPTPDLSVEAEYSMSPSPVAVTITIPTPVVVTEGGAETVSLTTSQEFVTLTLTSASLDAFLPTAAEACAGKEFFIKRLDSTEYTCSIKPKSGSDDTIEEGDFASLTVNEKECFHLVGDGVSDWAIAGKYVP